MIFAVRGLSVIASFDCFNFFLLNFALTLSLKIPLIVNSLFLLAFTSNADLGKFLFFGQGIEVWLIYTLIFFGLTSLAFAGTWLSGLIVQNDSEDKVDV